MIQQGYSLLALLFGIVLKVMAIAIMQENETKGVTIRKGLIATNYRWRDLKYWKTQTIQQKLLELKK